MPAATADLIQLDESVILAGSPRWEEAPQGLINVLQFAYDWNIAGAGEQFGTRQTYIHQGSADKYGRRPPLVIESRGLRTSQSGQALLDDRARAVTDRFGEPPRVLRVETFYQKHLLEAGDQVRVSHSKIGNPLTGLLGLVQEQMEVLNVTPMFAQGRVRLDLLWVGAIPPAAAPTAQGAVTTPAPLVGLQDLDQALGVETGGFAFFHQATFAGGTRYSYREATESPPAYAIVSGDRLEYGVLFDAASVDTRGGVDVAVLERSGTAQGGAAGSITLDSGASAVDAYYTTMWVEITGGTGTGQARKITGYVGSTKVASVTPNWTTAPVSGSVFRVVRLLSVEGGNDQNGFSAAPSTDLGSLPLGRWYLRTITLPAAWVGKTLVSAATALDTDDAGQVTMRVKDLRITNASGWSVQNIQRHSFTNQPVWIYVGETGVTSVTAERMQLGGATPTEGIVGLAITRGGIASGSAAVSNQQTETVRVTLSNVAFTASLNDTIRLWWAVRLTGHAVVSGPDQTVTWRLRRTGLTGPLIATYTMSPLAGKGTTSASMTRSEFAIDSPPTVGPQTYVLTQQCSSASGLGGQVDLFRLMTMARSA